MYSRNRHAQELREQTATQDSNCHQIQRLKIVVKKYLSNDVSIM